MVLPQSTRHTVLLSITRVFVNEWHSTPDQKRGLLTSALDHFRAGVLGVNSLKPRATPLPSTIARYHALQQLDILFACFRLYHVISPGWSNKQRQLLEPVRCGRACRDAEFG
jgi:hypothetical protein